MRIYKEESIRKGGGGGGSPAPQGEVQTPRQRLQSRRDAYRRTQKAIGKPVFAAAWHDCQDESCRRTYTSGQTGNHAANVLAASQSVVFINATPGEHRQSPRENISHPKKKPIKKRRITELRFEHSRPGGSFLFAGPRFVAAPKSGGRLNQPAFGALSCFL